DVHGARIPVEGHVEVLAERFVPGRQGQAEAQLGARCEALGVGDGQLAAPQRTLPGAGDVTVADEPDAPQFRVAEPHPVDRPAGGHARAPTGRSRRGPSCTGTAPPLDRSWPVPWLPPAGGVAEATTCSMPKPV